jgi:hypothetical protein
LQYWAHMMGICLLGMVVAFISRPFRTTDQENYQCKMILLNLFSVWLYPYYRSFATVYRRYDIRGGIFFVLNSISPIPRASRIRLH